MSPVGAISVSPARLSNLLNSASLPISSLLFQRHAVAPICFAPLCYPIPPRGIACLPIAPSRHGLSVRAFALAALSPSAHSHRVTIPLVSRPCIALCSTDHCRLLCQALQIVTHQGFAFAVPFESMPCPLLNQSVPSLRATLPSSPSQCPHISMQFLTSLRPCGSSPSRSGLYRHGALQPQAVLFTLNSYPRNPIPPHLIPNHINALPSPLLITA